MASTTSADTLAVTVHGPAGALDLVVPTGAAVGDVAREFAAQSDLSSPPRLVTRAGRELVPASALHVAGVRTGDVLVALPPDGWAPVPEAAPATPADDSEPVDERAINTTPLSALLWCASAAALAVVAGLLGARITDDTYRNATVALLGFATLCGLLPWGRYVEQRAAAAPAFAAAGAYILVYESGPDRYPLIIGIAALSAAVAAAVGRSITVGPTEPHDVWIATGLSIFAVTGLCVLCGWGPEVAWGFLLVLAMLAARFVPAFAVDVPDQMLIDLERLAINAWSARDRTTGRRTRTIIQPSIVDGLLGRGHHTVTAACAAILGVCLIAVPQLLATARYDTQLRGAQVLLFCAGASLLLAGRSYRHVLARMLLRASGLYCWTWLAINVMVDSSARVHWYVVLISVALAGIVAAAAIATGRGWRSVWWARRAEIAEGFSGAIAMAALVASSGLFAQLWQLKQ